MSEDLKKIREALEIATKEISFDTITNAREALRLFDAHVEDLSQQEAEPVAMFCRAEHSGDLGLQWNPSFDPYEGALLYSGPPKPAALPQPVASVPQDVERKCSECGNGEPDLSLYCVRCLNNDGWYLVGPTDTQDAEQFANDVAEWSQTQFEDVIRVSHFREFMRQRDAGSVRVPVEPSEQYLNEVAKICFEEFCGRPHPWEGVQAWVIGAMREAFSRGRKSALSDSTETARDLIEAFADKSGWKIENIRECIESGSAENDLTGFAEFKAGFTAGILAAVKAVEESQPPETTPWACVGAIRSKLLTAPKEGV